ncbi:hypothetical protein QWY79_14810 [Halomonas sabkhae]|uniref:Uncharacterized protein n=1 Tax=Halomonas halmophila TaxID=252 RepID=A0A4Y4F287_9GAMM|nr:MULTISPECIES: hypothetical protein [Halomonas]MDN3526539.1 hypothetical protein [Halomonas sabkhae]GED22775.1 hypothetical protein HHA01_17520 [Halomonas halmophila]
MKNRGLVLCLAVPVGFLLLLAGLIFGGQAISAIKLDSEIEQALAGKLASSAAIEVDKLQRVNNGYGYCGVYKSAASENGYASFFYNTINGRVTLDIESDRFTSNCGLSSFC